MNGPTLIPSERIDRCILFRCGEKVMLSQHLAELYKVPVKALNQAVQRNRERFPEDFMFRLNPREHAAMRSQFVTSKPGRGGRRYPPYAFTEQGVAMLSSVLRSERAVKVNIEIMRAFVRLRQWLATHADLARKLDALERRYDAQFRAVFDALRRLTTSPRRPRRQIGFHALTAPATPSRPEPPGTRR
jgi:hypothetical protein